MYCTKRGHRIMFDSFHNKPSFHTVSYAAERSMNVSPDFILLL